LAPLGRGRTSATGAPFLAAANFAFQASTSS